MTEGAVNWQRFLSNWQISRDICQSDRDNCQIDRHRCQIDRESCQLDKPSVKFVEMAFKLIEIAAKLIGTPVKIDGDLCAIDRDYLTRSVNSTRKKYSCAKSTFNACTAPGHLQLETDNHARTFAVFAFKPRIFGANFLSGWELVTNCEHAKDIIVSMLGINDRTQVMSLCLCHVFTLAVSKLPACKLQPPNIQTLDVVKYSSWAWQALIS